jgi:SagB-type dehydrogenase family enzyme
MSGAKHISVIVLLLVVVLIFGMLGCAAPVSGGGCETLKAELDKVRAEVGTVKTASLEELLRQRRSVRDYSDAPLTQEEVLKLLWAGQGITSARGGRTAPSAGALYPLEMYLVAGKVDNLAPGIYKYNPVKNDLTLVREGDVRDGLATASLGQGSVAEGAIGIVIVAVYERTTVKYGARGERYVHIEVGHSAQNICLEATALGLGLVTVGAFDDSAVAKIIGMAQDETPLYVIPVGRIRQGDL